MLHPLLSTKIMSAEEINDKWHKLAAQQTGEPVFSLFENWPGYFFYIPLALSWMLYGMRHRSLTLPLLSNPDIEFGGLCGESKCSILEQLGPAGKSVTSPYIRCTVQGREADASDLLTKAAAAGLSLPLVIKPDIGRRGTGVRIVKDAAAAVSYISSFPKGANVVVQQLAQGEGEAGVMYLRHPNEPLGRIVSLTLKYFPKVIGDGKHTLKQLILNDARACHLAERYCTYNKKHLDDVIPDGQPFKLTHVGNHVRGSLFRDGRQFITPQMQDAFERICRELPRFHLGRFDVRFEKLSDLCAGTNFTIIEVNGVGSEATHVWDRNAKLIPSYLALLSHIRSAFEIGSYYQASGIVAPKVGSILRAYLEERKLLALYPESEAP